MSGLLEENGRAGAGVRTGLWLILLLGIAAVVMLVLLRPEPGSPDARSGQVAVIAAPAAPVSLPAPADLAATHGAAIDYELRGIDRARGLALMAPHDGEPRPFRVGDEVRPGLFVADIRGGTVRLREGARIERIDLPPRLGGSGEPVTAGKEGLMPEPQPATGEASGAEIAQRLARSGASPSATPLPGEGTP